MFSTYFGYFDSLCFQNISKQLRLPGLKVKGPTYSRTVYFECSHQESNLDYRYRKPAFYPLNYESMRSSQIREYIKTQKFPVICEQRVLPGGLLANERR